MPDSSTRPAAAPLALQVGPLNTFLEEQLAARCRVVQWADIPDRDVWLRRHGHELHVAVTAAYTGITNEIMDLLPALKLVTIFGVGYDKVDLDYARRRAIHVTYTPDVLNDDVADLALALILAVMRKIPAADRHVRDGRWPSGPMPLTRKVTGSRFGIVGLGRIGKAIAARLRAFGTIAYTGTKPQAVDYAFFATPSQLAAACDVLIIAANANPSTRHLIDGEVLDALGPRGYLINIARGALIDEPALIDALASGRIAGAGLDVFEHEPNVPEQLRQLDNVVLLPHVASATVETREAMARLVLANLDAYLAGSALPTALT